jgi:hypothetical protein
MRMTGTRKAGLWTLGVAAVLWLVVVVATVTTPAEAGVNIGAAMLFTLAVPSTVAGVVLAIAGGSRPAPHQPVAPPRSAYPGTTLLAPPVAPPMAAPAYGNAPSGWGLALGVAGILSMGGVFGVSDAAVVIGVAVTVALGLAGAGLGWVGLRHVRAGRGGSRGLALAAIIVGITGAALNVFLVIEVVALLLA